MQLRVPLSGAVFVCLACMSSDNPDRWQGEWEGFVETTSQSVFTTVRLELEDSAWSGEVRLPGAPPLATSPDIRGDTILFELDLGAQQIAFTGVRATASLSGEAAVANGPVFQFSMQRLPEQASPKNRIDAWLADLEHVELRFLTYDRSYSTDARRSALTQLDQLRTDIRRLTDPEIVVRLSRIAAAAGNAHTRMYLLRNRQAIRRYPLRVWWFSDGLYVVRASQTFDELLGCRVLSIAGADVDSLRQEVGELFAGNESWIEYKSPYFMTSPEILQGLGLLSDTDDAVFEVACRDAGKQSFEVTSNSLVRLDRPTENWWYLSPRYIDSVAPLNSAFDTSETRLPLYLQQPSTHYWMDYLVGQDVLYVQYNRSQNMSTGAPLAEFAESVLGTIEARNIRAVIIDLRFNTGGNQGIARAFFNDLTQHPKIADRLFVITGPATFSAGIYHAAQLKQPGRATLVGAHPGDHLDSWSEGGNIVLPYSGYTMHFANGFHSGSSAEPPPGVRLMSDLSVESLEPDIAATMTFDQYLTGADPMLDAVLQFLASQ